VGFHKTGTTTTQEFLVNMKLWLKQNYGANVLMDQAKEWSFIPRQLLGMPNRNQAQCDALIAKLKHAFEEPGTTQIISAEDFSVLEDEGWHEFLRFMPPSVQVRVVVSHRATADWLRSRWIQTSKRETKPRPFSTAMAEFDRNRFAQVDQLRRMQRLFGSNCVHAVSYEGLREEDQSMSTYLVCNISAGLRGEAWSECKRQVARKLGGWKSNRSPEPIEVDVIRLASSARAKFGAQQECSEVVLFDFDGQTTLREVAAQLPSVCQSVDYKYEDVDREWNRVAALKAPRAVQHTICTVDESKLQDGHWQLLRDRVPGCATTGASSHTTQGTVEPSSLDQSGRDEKAEWPEDYLRTP